MMQKSADRLRAAARRTVLLGSLLVAFLLTSAGDSTLAQEPTPESTPYNIIKVWDVKTGAELPLSFKRQDTLNAVVFSPDGKTIAGGSYSGQVYLWEAATGKLISAMNDHKQSVESVAFSPDGKLLASGGFDRMVRMWNARNGAMVKTFEWAGGAILSVTFSPDGKLFATGGEGGVTSVREVETGREVMVGRLTDLIDAVTSLAFGSDGNLLAIGSRTSGTINIWDVGRNRRQKNFSLVGHTDTVESIAFSPGGKILASGSRDQTARLWDLDSGKELGTLAGHASAVNVVAFSSDGKSLATGSYDRTIKLWDVSTLKILNTLSGHEQQVTSVAFSPDANFLVSSSAQPRVESPSLHIFAVGINEYRDKALMPLRYPLRDAEAVSSALEGVAAGKSFQRVDKTVLHNPTRAELVERLVRLDEKIKPQDTLVFFYSGGGHVVRDAAASEEFYLLPSDAVMSNPQETAISASLLSRLFLKISAQQQLILLDTCGAGAGFESLSKSIKGKTVGLEGLIERSLVLLAINTSYEDFQQKHGTLTAALLKGLVGGASKPYFKITAHGLADSTRALLPNASTTRLDPGFKSLVIGNNFHLGDVLPLVRPAARSGRKSSSRSSSPGVYHAPEVGPLRAHADQLYRGIRARSGGVSFLPAGLSAQDRTRSGTNASDPNRTRSDVIDDTGPYAVPPRNGKDYALLIAVNNYDFKPPWNELPNPVLDARAISQELKDNYNFETELLEDPTREQVRDALLRYRRKTDWQDDDQLFIFFAGHGYFDEEFKEGYLILKNSRGKDDHGDSAFAHSTLSQIVDNIPCKHIFLVLDSCFSGTFDRSIARRGGDPPYEDRTNLQFIRQKMRFKSRRYLTSGGKEYVYDGVPGRHSPFARKLLEALRNYGGTHGVLTITGILSYLERVNPEPRQGEFGGNEPGGDFIFVAKKREAGNQ